MISRLVACVLLLSMVSANLSRFFIYAEFQANQQFIASVLCENRDKPQMHCEGKCYLMKKLKDAEEREKKQEQATQKNSGQDVFLISDILVFTFYAVTPKKQRPAAAHLKLPQISSEILHPPPAKSSLV